MKKTGESFPLVVLVSGMAPSVCFTCHKDPGIAIVKKCTCVTNNVAMVDKMP